MAGWFELSQSSTGQYHFNLKAGNGEIILRSEQYQGKASAENGIASVQANCSSDERYEKKTSSNGKLFFNLKASNHQIIGTSEMYESEQARENGISSTKTNGASTTVKDNT